MIFKETTTETKQLFEKISSLESLRSGFSAVKRNKGAAGVDGMTISEFETSLEKEIGKLREELTSWTYTPLAVKRVEIPKPDGGVRNLGIPSIRDRVVETAIKEVLEPIFDPEFSESSYGFRPGRGQQQAVAAAQAHAKNGKEYVVDIDLEKFFDTVHHDRLISQLRRKIKDPRVLRLIGMILRSGVMSSGLVHVSEEGVPQGSPLSPLLSNIVLDELDKELEKRQLAFCRFADDCNIFVASQKAAERVMGSITEFIEKKLRLKVNPAKSKVANSKFVKFLGMTILAGAIMISQKSLARGMAKVKELVRTRRGHESLVERIDRINRWYTGWSNYYSMTEYPSQLATIEAHIRRRLRASFVDNAKGRRRILYRQLKKRGVSPELARQTVGCNKKRWALSHTRALHLAYSNKYFVRIGLKVASNKELPHWKDVNVWQKFP